MRLGSLIWALPALILWATVSLAQSTPFTDYDAWSNTAARVERVIEADRATDATLDRLRAEVAIWRERFLEAQEDQSLRISTLERQLDALASLQQQEAPPDSDPASEPDAADAQAAAQEDIWITQRRAEIQSELIALQVPNVRAAEAFAHADGLIRQLDAMLRQRKTEIIFTRGPIPVNPLNWTDPVLELDGAIVAIPTEIVQNLRDGTERHELLRNLPQVLLFTFLGAFLLRRGRVWTAALSRSARAMGPPVISYPAQGMILLVEIALPWFGLVMLLWAAETSGLFGTSGEALLQAVRRFGLFAIVGTAFIRRLLPAADDDPEFVALAPEDVRRGRRTGLWIVYGLAFAQGFGHFLTQIDVSDETRSVVIFPFFVFLGYLLYRFSRLFTLKQAADGAAEEEATFSARLLDLVARLGILIGILSPLAAAAGYSGYAIATLMPAAYTIFALGLAAFLGAWLKELYAAIKRRNVEESDLAQTLIGVAVYAALIPVLALIWGARVTDLTEVWNSIREGFSFGGVQVSPTDILTFLLIFSVLYMLTRLLQSALRVSILPKTKLDVGSRTAIVSGLGYIGVFIAAIVAIQSTGLDLSSLAIVAGALSVGIGFGLQTIVSNFVSGIILLIERPISEGDWIDVNGNQGYVRNISVRSTRIETFDRTDVIVPNSDLIAGTVTNWTRGKLIGRIIVPVGVAYGTDPARVERILREISEAHPMVLLSPPPAILFMRFGADALEFEIRAILRDVNFSLSVKSDLNHEIAKRLKAEEIEIPFAQRDLWLRNPEVLSEGRSFSNTGRHFVERPPEPPEPRVPRPSRDEVTNGDGEADGEGDAR